MLEQPHTHVQNLIKNSLGISDIFYNYRKHTCYIWFGAEDGNNI